MLSIATVMLLGCSALAQTPVVTSSSNELQSCLMKTDPGRWGALLLTTDQMERVRRVQEACLEECTAAAGKAHADNPISNADGSTVMAELKNILTTEQYTQWVAGCAERAQQDTPTK